MKDENFNKDLATALMLTSNMIFHKNMDNFCQSKVDQMYPVDLSILNKSTRIHKSLWVAPFSKSFDNENLLNLIYELVEISKPLLSASVPSDEIQKFIEDKGDEKLTSATSLYEQSKAMLNSNEKQEYWIALVMCALARIISIKATETFDKEDLSSPGIDWLQLESLLLLGEGKQFAVKLLDLQSKDVQLNKLISEMVPSSLAELSLHAQDIYFFRD